jgi:hypothetical protein
MGQHAAIKAAWSDKGKLQYVLSNGRKGIWPTCVVTPVVSPTYTMNLSQLQAEITYAFA